MATKPVELTADQARLVCDEASLEFDTTADLPELTDIIGQGRAVEAIEFGMDIDGTGFNIYVLGPAGTGKASAVRRFVEERATGKRAPDDWCYVHSFAEPNRPLSLRLPAGKGREFRSDMQTLVLEVRRGIQRELEREQYEDERNAIMQRVQQEQGEKLAVLERKASERGFTIHRGPGGIAIVPVVNGEPLTPQQFAQLPEQTRKEVQERGQQLQEAMQKTMRELRDLERETKDKLAQLERETVLFAVEHHIDDLKRQYAEFPDVCAYLDAVKEDVVSNAEGFQAIPEGEGPQQLMAAMMAQQQRTFLQRYQVNLIVDHSGTQGAPVVVEHNPTYQNLIGRIERQAQFGTLTTNFMMIRAGALHRANGGYLIVEADHLLRQPFAYDALKHAVKDREIKVTDLGEMLSTISTTQLEPVPIPLDVKVILIGNPVLYYLLHGLDEEFPELFKVKADFNTFMDRTPESIRLYAQFLGSQCQCEGWRAFDRSGIARIIEYGSELVGDQTKLSTRFSDICDIAREAAYWAEKAGSEAIRRADVQQAIDAKIRRANRIEELIQEMIDRGDLFIDTEGEVVGQINGLAVMSLGGYLFGKPSRITARTYMGKGQVVNIEREVELGGPIHNKGVLILSGYLNGKYGTQRPISLSASLGFEQQYEGVEGDSASSAELYALLSSLSGFPVRQGLAVTGSVNQRGDVQPIGGVTQKVEGFFDVCKAKGLTGDQGVLIPKANVRNLMLRDEVVQAIRDGQFHLYPVTSVDQGIELLAGRPAGELGPDGTYPEGAVNRAVEDRLAELAERWKAFAKGPGEGEMP